MNLTEAQIGEEYIIKAIETDDEEMDAFLFTLGCYSGEPITVISRKKGGCVERAALSCAFHQLCVLNILQSVYVLLTQLSICLATLSGTRC